MKDMTIGALAKEACVNVETVRFYEKRELLQRPAKRGSFRYYSEDYTKRIRFIKRAKELGFSLAEVKELLELHLEDSAKCSDLLDRAEDKINQIDQKINDLKKIKKSLKKLSSCCDDKSISLKSCLVVDCFMTIQ